MWFNTGPHNILIKKLCIYTLQFYSSHWYETFRECNKWTGLHSYHMNHLFYAFCRHSIRIKDTRHTHSNWALYFQINDSTSRSVFIGIYLFTFFFSFRFVKCEKVINSVCAFVSSSITSGFYRFWIWSGQIKTV